MKSFVKRIAKPAVLEMAGRCGPHRRGADAARLWVLMYHRVLPRHDKRFALEEPGMQVRPETLDMHLREVKKYFVPVMLSDWLKSWEEGKALPSKACAITFDDGWRDNYEYAFPILKAHNVPATLFAVADKIGTDDQFWPNRVAALIDANAGDALREHPDLQAAMSDLSLTLDALPDVIQRLKQVDDEKINQATEAINWRSLCKRPPEPALMDWAQLKTMSQSGLIDIGSHTKSHQRLDADLSTDALFDEVVQSRQRLEAALDKPVDLFCFPNGDYSVAAMNLVSSSYRAAVTTQRGINSEATMEPHRMTRIGIHEDVSRTPKQFSARLSGWV